MGKMQRTKGRLGQQKARDLLAGRNWSVAELNSGKSAEDFIAIDPNGKAWSVEVKNTANMTMDHVRQARRQGKERRMPWLLMQHIHDSRFWLVRGQGLYPMLWEEQG